ncbi:hypothetical protein F5I97DRAFT_1930709 [Phlebopus sp. FC_14]|nr:hypothetical protein F5I97DRAFT_1930709 [Phlebopus sp. FC_14]
MLVLEEDIARLQARVQELENPNNSAPSVELYSPYVPLTAQIPLPRAAIHQVLHTARSSSPSSASSTTTSSNESARTFDSPHHNVQLSLSIIAPQAAECGFFLDIERLGTRGSSIVPALHTTMILWAAHLSQSQSEILEQGLLPESSLLARALHQLSDALSASTSTSSPQTFMHILQSEVLLAVYLQRTGQVLGARYHASAALSIAVGMQLHTESSQAQSPSLFSFVGNYYPQLPPPVDAVEERERVDAFWTVYSLDMCLAVIDNASPTINSAVRITAPWPGTSWANEAGSNPVHPATGGTLVDTVKQFLSGQVYNPQPESALSLQAKATVLLSEAASIAASYTTGTFFFEPSDHYLLTFLHFQEPSIGLPPDMHNRLTMLDRLIHQFSASLQAPSISSTESYDARQVLLTITLSALAHITLHRPFAPSHSPSNKRCIDSVFRVVHALDGVDVQEIINPICVDNDDEDNLSQTIWIALCFILHQELIRLRAERFQSSSGSSLGWISSSQVASHSEHREEAEILHALQKLLSVLSEVVGRFPSKTLNTKFEALLPIFQSIE